MRNIEEIVFMNLRLPWAEVSKNMLELFLGLGVMRKQLLITLQVIRLCLCSHNQKTQDDKVDINNN